MTKLEEDFKRHLAGGRFFNKHDRLIVAVSTGVDSMVLLTLLERLPVGQRPQLVVAHVNHELREQSTAEETFLRDYCHRRRLALVVKHWPVDQHPQTGVENAARQFRYRFFTDLMKKGCGNVLVTAHHQNDLAETMLMKLVRGGQLSQLVGIADQRPFAGGRLVRPLLPFAKKRLFAYARAQHITWFDDASNRDTTVTRNRYRWEIIPALERENPRLLDQLSSYHRQLSALLAWQDQETADQLSAVLEGGAINLNRWRQLPAAAQEAVLQRWLEKSVLGIKQSLVEEAVNFLRKSTNPQQTLPLPTGLLLVKSYQRCLIMSEQNFAKRAHNPAATVVELGQWYRISDQQRLMVAASPAAFLTGSHPQEMWLAPEQFPLTLRRWQTGDYLRLKNGGHQLVRRVLIDQKVPNSVRAGQQVLADANGEVVWLLGRKWGWFARPADFRRHWRQIFIGIQND